MALTPLLHYNGIKTLALTSLRGVAQRYPENLADCGSLTSRHDSEQSQRCGDPACPGGAAGLAADGQNVSQLFRHKEAPVQYGKRLTPPENAQMFPQPLGRFSRGEFVPSVHALVPWLTL